MFTNNAAWLAVGGALNLGCSLDVLIDGPGHGHMPQTLSFGDFLWVCCVG